MRLSLIFKLVTALLIASSAVADENRGPAQLVDDEIVNVEGVYNTQSSQSKENRQQELPAQLSNQKQAVEVQDLKDLNRLAPFSEVSVIQKKFLPKTQRFQLFVAGSVMTNTPWYNNVGAKLNLAYHFTENFGLEINSHFMTNSERESTKEIKDEHNLVAEQFIYTKNYVGLDLMWSPMYGKIAGLDESVVPFDMYFTIGGGTSATNSQEENVATLHLGVGQIFAISKSMAIRWDYSFNTFAATPIVTAGASGVSENRTNDLVLSAGLSFFFPEASYR